MTDRKKTKTAEDTIKVLPSWLFDNWGSKGFNGIVDVMHVTSIAKEEENLKIITQDGRLGEIQVFLAQFDENIEIVDWKIVSRFVDSVYQYSFQRRSENLLGNYIRILSPYREIAEKSSSYKDIEYFVNLVRLKLGMWSIGRRLAETEWNIKKRTFSRFHSAMPFATAGLGGKDTKYFRSAVESNIISFPYIMLNERAHQFYSLSCNVTEELVQFTLVWHALEAQLGGGGQRKKFCLDEIKSPIINNEMKLLHDIRSEYLHKGISKNVTTERLSELLELLRMSALPDGVVRRKLVKLFEATIQDNPDGAGFEAFGKPPHIDLAIDQHAPPELHEYMQK